MTYNDIVFFLSFPFGHLILGIGSIKQFQSILTIRVYILQTITTKRALFRNYCEKD